MLVSLFLVTFGVNFSVQAQANLASERAFGLVLVTQYFDRPWVYLALPPLVSLSRWTICSPLDAPAGGFRGR